jgi:hypothetical protein
MVKSDGFAVGRSLPVYPYQQTFIGCVGLSQTCHGTKSLRDSPLRGELSPNFGDGRAGQAAAVLG